MTHAAPTAHPNAGPQDRRSRTFFDRLSTLEGKRGRAFDFALGAAAVLGLAPFHIWGAAILALAGLFIRLEGGKRFERPQTRTRRRAFWFGLGFFAFGVFWIGAAFIARGPAFIPLMVPMVAALCVLLALFWAAAGWAYGRLAPRGIWPPIIFAGLFFLAEFARGHLLGGLPWNLPGYIFRAGGAPSQSAAYIGIYGLTYVVFLASGLLGRAALSIGQSKRRPAIAALSGLAALLFGLFLFGMLRLSGAPVLEYHENVKLRIAQTPFDQGDKFDPEKSIGIVNNYLSTSAHTGLEDVTHVIWPEGAINGLALENEALMRAVSATLLSADKTPPVWLVNTLRGELRQTKSGETVTDYFNSSAALIFQPDGSAVLGAINDKSKLVPFGEFVPGGKWLADRGIMPMSTALASLSPAPTKELADFPGLPRLSPQICYEIIFPGMTPWPKPSQTTAAPEWILNQSNDGWYGQSTGPRQHANQAAYRAIEEGLPIVRAAANGISGVIDPYGRWLVRAEPQETRAVDSPLPKAISAPKTGYNFSWLIVLINFFACLWYGTARFHLYRDAST
jgi:apolipoprotein N-acyltransferase